MDEETRRRLRALNRLFYRVRAAEFGASRSHPWPGWRRLLERVGADRSADAAAPLRVLDVGCGNARFARFLCEGLPRELHYLGIDESEPLLAQAREQCAALPRGRYELRRLDALEPEPGAALPPGPFDLVVAFGLFHHVPGHATRRQLLRAMLARTAPGGLVALSAWRFGRDPRFARGLVDWQLYNARAEQPIDLAQLEPGDCLLCFGDDPDAPPRYCHHASDEEIERLCREAEAETLDCYEADGRSGDLNRHLVLQRR